MYHELFYQNKSLSKEMMSIEITLVESVDGKVHVIL